MADGKSIHFKFNVIFVTVMYPMCSQPAGCFDMITLLHFVPNLSVMGKENTGRLGFDVGGCEEMMTCFNDLRSVSNVVVMYL